MFKRRSVFSLCLCSIAILDQMPTITVVGNPLLSKAKRHVRKIDRSLMGTIVWHVSIRGILILRINSVRIVHRGKPSVRQRRNASTKSSYGSKSCPTSHQVSITLTATFLMTNPTSKANKSPNAQPKNPSQTAKSASAANCPVTSTSNQTNVNFANKATLSQPNQNNANATL